MACVVRKKDTNIKEEDIINFVAEKVIAQSIWSTFFLIYIP